MECRAVSDCFLIQLSRWPTFQTARLTPDNLLRPTGSFLSKLRPRTQKVRSLSYCPAPPATRPIQAVWQFHTRLPAAEGTTRLVPTVRRVLTFLWSRRS